MQKLGAVPDDITGYRREEYSHLAVAAAVSGGSADAGLGILSAARALELEFVPLFNEEYDLIIPTLSITKASGLRPLLGAAGRPGGDWPRVPRDAVDALGGYDVSPMGELRAMLS